MSGPLFFPEPETAPRTHAFPPRCGEGAQSPLPRLRNQRDWASAANELRRWVYGGGKVLPGLVTRRDAERALVLSDSPREG